MGPLYGTIAGVGAWFSLVFKSAFALAGLGAYLLVFVDVPAGDLGVTLVSLGVATLLLVVNAVGVEQSGRLQAGIVTLVLVALVAFVADGLTYVDQGAYHPFFGTGSGGVLAATGFVFVSYAGVTKIASVAEEVENPGRNIPVGILGSILSMMVLYTLVVFVVVGVVPAARREDLQESLTPMSMAAVEFLGEWGEIAIAVVAVLALTSMANAGILSSSRFPLAMSRDALAPPALGEVHDQFRTPVYAIALTGVVLLALIAFVPVVELAKLASAFQILVFVFVNAALVAFRESELASYDPEFVAPAYPWIQLFGILGGVVLLIQMGPLPIAGAAGLVLAGLAWYRVYGRDRTEREGAALAAIRRGSAGRALDRTRDACESEGPERVLVPVGSEPSPTRRSALLGLIRIATDVAEPGGRVRVVRFEEVPEQLDLETARRRSPGDPEFEVEDGLPFGDLDGRIEFGEVVTHDARRAIAHAVDRYDADLVLGEWESGYWRSELLDADVDWYMRHLDSDVAFMRNRGYDTVDEVAVVVNQGPFDPLEVVIADGIATARNARIQFVAALAETATEEQVMATGDYLRGLAGFCTAESEVTVRTGDDRVEGVVAAAGDADLVVVGTSAHHLLYDVVFGTFPDRLAERLACTVVLAHSRRSRSHTFLRAVFDRIVYE